MSQKETEKIMNVCITKYQDFEKYEHLVQKIKEARIKFTKVTIINDLLDNKYSRTLINFDTSTVTSIDRDENEISPQIKLGKDKEIVSIQFLYQLDNIGSNHNSGGLGGHHYRRIFNNVDSNINKWYQI